MEWAKIIKIIVTLAIVSVVLVVFNRSNTDLTFQGAEPLDRFLPDTDHSSISVEPEQGTEDNPYARSNFEKLRTQNPATETIPENIRKKELAFARNLPKSDQLHLMRNGRADVIDFSFESRGPINVGGRTRALALDITDTNQETILAGGVSGGMWRTTDLGQSWVQTSAPEQFPSVTCLVQDTRDGKENIWYYGTGEINGNSADGSLGAFYRGDGIYKSTDSGLSWSVIPSTGTGDITTTDNPMRYVNNIVIDTSNEVEDEMYAAIIDGIVRTTDGFETFEFVLGNTDNVSLNTDVAITSDGTLYATISDDSDVNDDVGIWTSENGTDWQEIALPEGKPTSGFQKTSIGISPSNENIVYFLRTEESGDEFNLYVYNAETETLTARPQSALPSELNTQNSYNQYVKIHPDNTDIVFLGGVNLYRSTNGFEDSSTTEIIGGNSITGDEQLYIDHYVDQHNLIFLSNDKAISANDGGISYTENILKSDLTVDSFQDTFFDETVSDQVRVEWDAIDRGYKTSQFYTVAINQSDRGFPWITGGLQDNSSIISDVDNANQDWGTLFGGDGAFTQVTYNSLIVSAQFGQAVRFSIVDDGTETDNIFPPEAGESDKYSFVNPILADPVVPNKVFVASRGEVFYTYDVTENPQDTEWLSLGSNDLNSDELVSAMDASVVGANQLFIGTFDLATGLSRILRVEDTNDPNSSITDLTISSLPEGGYINSIEVDPRDEEHVVLTYSNYGIISLYSSEDGGDTWSPVAGNLEENEDGTGSGVSTRWLEIMPNGDNNIYLLGTSAGLFYTETLDGMNTLWTQTGVGSMGNVVVDMLAVRPSDGYVVVSTHGKGIFQTKLDVPIQPNIYLAEFPCQGREFTLFASRPSESDNLSYQWFANGEAIPDLNSFGISGPSLDEPVNFQVEVTNNSTGASGLSNELIITPENNSFCSALSVQSLAAKGLKIFPNPARDHVKISGNRLQPHWQYSIIGLGGNEVLSGQLNNGDIDISHLSKGIYVLKVHTDKELLTDKFVKQ